MPPLERHRRDWLGISSSKYHYEKQFSKYEDPRDLIGAGNLKVK